MFLKTATLFLAFICGIASGIFATNVAGLTGMFLALLCITDLPLWRDIEDNAIPDRVIDWSGISSIPKKQSVISLKSSISRCLRDPFCARLYIADVLKHGPMAEGFLTEASESKSNALAKSHANQHSDEDGNPGAKKQLGNKRECRFRQDVFLTEKNWRWSVLLHGSLETDINYQWRDGRLKMRENKDGAEKKERVQKSHPNIVLAK